MRTLLVFLISVWCASAAVSVTGTIYMDSAAASGDWQMTNNPMLWRLEGQNIINVGNNTPFTNWPDSSGNGWTFTNLLNSSCYYVASRDGHPAYMPSDMNGGLTASPSLTSPTNNFTFFAVFDSSAGIITYLNQSAGLNALTIYGTTSQHIQVDQHGIAGVLTSASIFTNDVIQWVVFTMDASGTNCFLYLNGVLDTNRTVSVNTFQPDTAAVGPTCCTVAPFIFEIGMFQPALTNLSDLNHYIHTNYAQGL